MGIDKEASVPRLSILIPCFDPAAELEDTLVSVLQNRPRDCEVLVIHTQQYSDPYNLRDEVQLLRVSGRVSLCQLANSGLAAATGEVVHLLLPGMAATENWTDEPLSHFDDPEVACVAPIVVQANDPTKLVSAGVTRGWIASRKVVGAGAAASLAQPRRWNVLGPTFAAGFYRRSVLESLGGIATHLTDDLADIDLALSIQALGLLSILEPKSRLIEQQPVAKPKSSVGLGKARELLFWRHAQLRGPVSLLLHPIAAMAESVAASTGNGGAVASELVGRLLGLAAVGTAARHGQKLADARETLAAGEAPASLSLAEARREKSAADQTAAPARRAA